MTIRGLSDTLLLPALLSKGDNDHKGTQRLPSTSSLPEKGDNDHRGHSDK